MKRILPFALLMFMLFCCLSSEDSYADMSGYCLVPPYVIQDVPANIMFLVDNSGSMWNLANACISTYVATSGTNTNAIPVKSVSGFKAGQAIELIHSGAATQVWITSIDSTNNILTVGANVAAFSPGDTVMDKGCSDTNGYYFDQPSSACPTSTTATCNNPGSYPSTTTSQTKSSSTTYVCVNDVTGFTNGESILIGTTARTIASSNGVSTSCSSNCTSGKCLIVTSSLTYNSGVTVKDSCYDYSTSGGNIAFSDVSDFSVGEVIVVVHGGTPYTTTITAKNTSTTPDSLQVTPAVTIAANDPIYDYTCYNYQTPYPEHSFDPTQTYYGYFNGSYWYTYSSSRFLTSRLKSAGAKASTEWDGNFLNWLTMRRRDIIRKALTGGNDCTVTGGSCAGSESAGYGRLRGVKPDGSSRGIYKAVQNAEQYMDCSSWSCTANTNASFTFATGGSDPSSFTAYTGAATSWTSRGSFNVDVRARNSTSSPIAGVIQNVVGAKARIGLAVYNLIDGGNVPVNVSGTSMSSVISNINTQPPSANTPLAESLWTVVGYFAQQSSMLSGPGPRWNSSDFTIGNAADPLNYGTSTSPRWPSCSKSYVLLITDGEPCQDGSLPSTLKDYAAGRSIFNCQNSSCPALAGSSPDTYSFPAAAISGCSSGSVAGLEDVALYMHTNDLRSDISKTQNLTLYTVYAFGKGSMLLRFAAINGGFNDFDGSGKPDQQAKWNSLGKVDENGYSIPDNYYEAADGYSLEASLQMALSTMLSRASSGTAASVLASGQGSGANLIQAVFYPRRKFGNDVISWTGENQNLWYYIDPFFNTNSIREDTLVETPDRIQDLVNDYVVQLYFDTTAQQAMAKRFQDVNGDGSSLVAKSTVTLENLSSIWKAGSVLWRRDPVASPRTIYTPCLSGGSCISSKNLMTFTESPTDNSSSLAPYLQMTTDAAGIQTAKDIIRFVHGYRTTSDGFSFDYNPSPPLQIVDRNADGEPDYRMRTVTVGKTTNIWKLGDIINSTPKISSWLSLNSYDTRYNDTSYKNFTSSSTYTNRGLVFTGANDGLLHAFKLGQLVLSWSGQGVYQKAKLVNPDTSTPIGYEQWAFIPKNALPYLPYTADPNYCHSYSVDLTPVILDASIGAPGSGDVSASLKTTGNRDCSTPGTCDWRTILIGGMRWGGACRKTGTACNSGQCSVTTGTSCTTNSNCPSGETCVPNCVNTPITDPSDSTKGLGYSSYFALDVTDQSNPSLLWEYSSDNLGFATTGPAIVRVGDKATNGKWFAVFGSGPTGPMDTTNFQFLGRSDQPLKFFVVDLKTGALAATIDPGIPTAFSGSLYNASVDTDYDYQDDAVYAGYVKKSGSTWTDGGIGTIVTKHDPNPAHWTWRTVMDGIGPVTSAVANIYDTRKGILWLYFGTGRYFYEQSTTIDDQDSQRYLIGMKDPCFNTTSDVTGLTNSCTSTVGLSSLTDVSSIGNVPTETVANSSGFKGWYIKLDGTGSYTYSPDPAANFRAERVVTDTVTSTTGNVIFTSYKPYSDECSIGGKSFVWATRYNTGGAPGSLLKGTALLQTSTGAITSMNLSNAFTLAGGRKSGSVEGYSSERPPSTIELPQPVKKAIHVRER
ncbi:MAG TPA: hypothetical protein VFG09_07975 [Thermodesulfovibrionales bacterium]|nr:hypothetical protein [Thermodesulfovibrionales bacterium]